ncbi:MAG TPA: hypothetical protein PKD46_10625 [Aggregatilineaceae bacterium]|nr:hypothetical protein [Anaerolineae bacterium]HMM28728.1 hypothetical protein [Aggregatilineaceae bacterium]
MADYSVNYTWDASHAVPLLIATVSGRVLSDLTALPRIIDQAHAIAEQHTECEGLYVAYDFSRTERRLPLDALMKRTRISGRVRGVYVIGAGSRKDEMAALIMSAAKRLPYPVVFYPTLDALYAALRAQNALR